MTGHNGDNTQIDAAIRAMCALIDRAFSIFLS